jgi:hypothetical protein
MSIFVSFRHHSS